MRVYVGLMLRVLSSGFFPVSYCSAGLGRFSSGLCKFYANAGGKQPIQRKLLLVQYKQQANLLFLIHNYSPLVINKNDKNKQLTIIMPT
jgi:hypothetical protein